MRERIAKDLATFSKNKDERTVFKYLAVLVICLCASLLVSASLSECVNPPAHLVMVLSFTMVHTIENFSPLL